MKIAIRADGGCNIGMGHIMRTLVLAKELSRTNEVFYICRTDRPLSDKYKRGIDKIKAEGFTVKTIREDSMLLDISDIKADLLITDSYDVDSLYFDDTKLIFSKTAYIDDMNFCKYNVDFLINQNINACDLNYSIDKKTKLLLGSKYIMLREEFRNAPEKFIKEEPQDIMITVGGADPYHITEQILDYVKNLSYNFHVIVGTSFSNNNFEIYEADNICFYYNANMNEIMKKCDAAISACGSTLYELASCSVPTLGIIIADNQQGIANKMSDIGAIKCVGWYNKLSKDTFLQDFSNLCNSYILRKEMSNKAKKIVDGKGVYRIVQELTKKE